MIRLNASTGISSEFGVAHRPTGIAFDGTNVWVTNQGSNDVAKILASTGATLGTYPVGLAPIASIFDGTNIWVANNKSNAVTKLLASTSANVGTYPAGTTLFGIAFDGTNIWVTNNQKQHRDQTASLDWCHRE